MSGGRVYVIAGNHREFLYYYPKPDRNIVYVASERQLRGCHGGKIVRVGTWYERPDLEAIEREVAYVEMDKKLSEGKK